MFSCLNHNQIVHGESLASVTGGSCLLADPLPAGQMCKLIMDGKTLPHLAGNGRGTSNVESCHATTINHICQSANTSDKLAERLRLDVLFNYNNERWVTLHDNNSHVNLLISLLLVACGTQVELSQ